MDNKIKEISPFPANKSFQGPKGVGLLSGGLDSILAALILKSLSVKVFAVTFAMPWGSEKQTDRVRKMTEESDIPLKIFQLGDDYLKMLFRPKYGYGRAFNPCMDCHIYMLKKAAEYMREIDADFVFTGEVMGQRPNSQRRDCLPVIENEAGLPGRLLRPLSARLLPETIMEAEGRIDRNALFDISGRSRKTQLDLARKFNLTGFSTPAGGCLLTEQPFSNRLKDFIQHTDCDFAETRALKYGRYFRLNENFCFLLGRDEKENARLIEEAGPNDLIFEFPEEAGPNGLLKGLNPGREILELAAALAKYHSKSRNSKTPVKIRCFSKFDSASDILLDAGEIGAAEVEKMRR